MQTYPIVPDYVIQLLTTANVATRSVDLLLYCFYFIHTLYFLDPASSLLDSGLLVTQVMVSF